MVFFCFSRLDRSINKSSPPCCLLLLCKMPTTSLTALLLPFKFLLLLGLDFRVFFCLFVFFLFSEGDGEGREQNFIPALYALSTMEQICTEMLQHHPDYDLVPEVVFNSQAPKQEKKRKEKEKKK